VPTGASAARAGAVTLGAALARHADLLGPVNKAALQALAAFAGGAEAARLRRLVSPDGAAEYKAWHCQSCCLLEVLEEFPGVRPPLGAPELAADAPLPRRCLAVHTL
jgi:sulfite reductase alpha subunit-like flavoprotein